MTWAVARGGDCWQVESHSLEVWQLRELMPVGPWTLASFSPGSSLHGLKCPGCYDQKQTRGPRATLAQQVLLEGPLTNEIVPHQGRKKNHRGVRWLCRVLTPAIRPTPFPTSFCTLFIQ